MTLAILIAALVGRIADGETASVPQPGSPPVLSGCEPDYPPFCIVTPDNQADGFSVELLRAALKAMGREVVFKTGPWAELKQDLADGKLEVLPLVGRTPEREALYDFTVPYLTMHGALFIRRDTADIRTWEDVKDKRVAVMKGDNAEEYVRRVHLSDRILTSPSFEGAFKMLADGRADAVVAQKLMGISLLKHMGLASIQVVGRPNEEFAQTFSFAVRKGNGKLLATLNEGLAIVLAEGINWKLERKWLGVLEPDFEWRRIAKTVLWVTVMASLLAAIALGIIFTLRRQVRNRTRERSFERAFLDRIINAIPVRVFWKDKNLLYLGCNAVFARDAGFADPQDIVGKDDYQMGWRDQAEMYRADDRTVIASGHPRLLMEEPQTTPAGDTIWLITSKVPLRDPTGEIRGVLGTYMDITERKRMEAQQQALAEQLRKEQKQAAVGTLALGVGHEINNPIMGIMNYAQLIKDRLQGTNEAVEEFAGEIVIEAERIAGIVRGLSAFATRDIATRVAVPVSDLVEAALSAKRATLSHDHITLTVDVPADLPTVSCDRRQIVEVLTGLLSNARDALNEKYPGADDDKRILITVREILKSDPLSVAGPNTEPRTLNTRRILRLTVEDHGIGIPAAVREHIFEPFFTTKDKSVGAGSIGKGLGLFVSYATVQEHGGVLSVESEVGQWTRVHVELPVAPEPSSMIRNKAPEAT